MNSICQNSWNNGSLKIIQSKQIICYSKYCKELPNEKDRTFTFSRSKPDEVWNVSMTPLAYKVQGYPALSDK